jgi:hypothetical protein
VIPAFEFSTYQCVVTKIRAGFDQDVFISDDNYTIRLIDVLQNREKELYHGHANLILDISTCKKSIGWCHYNIMVMFIFGFIMVQLKQL